MTYHLYFSPWVLLWSILYYFKIIPYNPLIMLYLISLFSIIVIFGLLLNNVNLKIILIYSLIVLLPKLIMILLLDNKNILEGFYISIIIFSIYLFYIYCCETNMYELYYINSYYKLINSDLSNHKIIKYFLDIDI